MKIGRSEAHNSTAKYFGDLARQITNDALTNQLRSLVEKGLLNLPEQAQAWSLVSASIEALAQVNPGSALASALNLLARDVLVRAQKDTKSELAEKIEKGQVIASVAGADRNGALIDYGSQDGRIVLNGEFDCAGLMTLADLTVLLAAGQDGAKCIVLSKEQIASRMHLHEHTVGISDMQVATVSFKQAVFEQGAVTGIFGLSETDLDMFKARFALCMAALLCGCAARGLEQVRGYFMESPEGPRQVFTLQAQSFQLADMFSYTDTLRLMLDRAAFAVDAEDRNARVLCECARLLADETIEELTMKGSRILGLTMTDAGIDFQRSMNDAATIRFIGGNQNTLLDSIYNLTAEHIRI